MVALSLAKVQAHMEGYNSGSWVKVAMDKDATSTTWKGLTTAYSTVFAPSLPFK